MKNGRMENAARNAIFGVISKIYQIVLPFVIRTILIYSLGIEYLGLNSLFTSILQILNLAEMGIGSAMIYSMYKPITVGDQDTICALMGLYRKYYRIIGFIVLFIGGCIYPFIPQLISGDIPNGIDINILYLLNLGTTVLTYWLFAYKICLLNAHQRNDIESKVQILMDTLKYLGQILALVFFRSYYIYLCVNLLLQILNNIFTALIVSKMYPEYSPKGSLEESEIKLINRKVRDLFTSKLGAVIMTSVDSVVISAFLGLKSLAIYNNYYFIMKSLINIINTIYIGAMSGVGNSLILETKEKNYRSFNKFTFIIVWITGFFTCCLLCLYQPFIKLWVGEENKLHFQAVICFCVYFFVFELYSLLNLYKDAAGLWHKDRFRPMVTACCNLTLNLWLVKDIGVYGVLLSTISATIVIDIPWLLNGLFKELFQCNIKQYLQKLTINILVIVGSCYITWLSCSLFTKEGIISFLCKIVLCCVAPNLIYIVVYRKTKEYKEIKGFLVKLMVRRG